MKPSSIPRRTTDSTTTRRRATTRSRPNCHGTGHSPFSRSILPETCEGGLVQASLSMLSRSPAKLDGRVGLRPAKIANQVFVKDFRLSISALGECKQPSAIKNGDAATASADELLA